MSRWRVPSMAVLACAASALTACDSAEAPTRPAPPAVSTPTAQSAQTAARKAAAPRRMLISGHSLVDQPLPDQLAAIAQSLGTPLDWDRQYIVGSSIRQRTAGDAAGGAWNGYRSGDNRSGRGLDLLRELRSAGAGPEPYDALLITEQHSLLGTLVWNDTVRHLRHFHDRFIEANAAGRTWFYEPWLDIDDAADPRRWIAHERRASTVWRCVATRVNVSLEAEGRSDRIASLPAGLALVHLVEQATRGPGVAGIGGTAAAEAATDAAITATATATTVRRLLRDDVHLTPLGSYYLALVSYAVVFERSPIGAWAPDGVSAEQAASLQRVASDFAAAYRADGGANDRALSLPECRRVLQRSFIVAYWSYVRDVVWRKEQGAAAAWWRWARHVAEWQWRFSRDDAGNPFHFDPATDKTHWLPKPG